MQGAAEQPGHDQRALPQRRVDVGRRPRRAARAEREPGGAQVLRLDGEEVADGRGGVARHARTGHPVQQLGDGAGAAAAR